MKVLAAAIVFSFCLSAHNSWAATEIDCEGEALTPAARLVKHARLGLQKRELDPGDIEYMVGDSSRVRNPYLNKTKSIENLSFRQKLKSHLLSLKPDEVESARTALGALIDQNVVRETQIQTAREKTNWLFAPEEVKLKTTNLRFEGTDAVQWQKSPDGRLRLLKFDSEKARLEFFDPRTTKSLETREIIPNIKRGIELIHMERGHVLSLSKAQDRNENAVVIYDVKNNKTGPVNFVSPKVEDVQLVRAKDQSRFLIARTTTNFIIYRILPDLSLQEFDEHPFKNSYFDVLNSEEGHAWIVAVGESRKSILIFDPTGKGISREVPIKSHFINAQSTLLPDGSYAVAIRTSSNEFDELPIRYDFILKDVANPLSSEMLPRSSDNGRWYVTSTGRAIFPVTLNLFTGKPEFEGHIQIYEPLTANLKPVTGASARITGPPDILYPSQTLQSDSLLGKPSFYEFPNGRLLILMAGSDCIKIFEPAVQDQPIHNIATQGDDEIVRVEMFYVESMKDFIFIVRRLRDVEVYSGWSQASKILDVHHASAEALAADVDGHVYLPVQTVTSVTHNSKVLQLYRITSNGSELQ